MPIGPVQRWAPPASHGARAAADTSTASLVLRGSAVDLPSLGPSPICALGQVPPAPHVEKDADSTAQFASNDVRRLLAKEALGEEEPLASPGQPHLF